MYHSKAYRNGYADGYYDYLEGYDYYDGYEQYGWDVYCEGYEDGWYAAMEDCEDYGIC